MTSDVAHQFDDADQQREAATLGMWVFLVTEVMFFGGMFTGYTVYRHQHFAAFEAGSHHLDRTLGGINTGVLLTSSLAMAFAVHAIGDGRRKMASVCLLITIGLGTVFLGIKGYEYWHKYETGLVPGPSFHASQSPDSAATPALQMFFVFYFVMTGVHALHMVVGISLLSILALLIHRGKISAGHSNAVENAGLYWHFVDAIWVFLYPLLYLIEI